MKVEYHVMSCDCHVLTSEKKFMRRSHSLLRERNMMFMSDWGRLHFLGGREGGREGRRERRRKGDRGRKGRMVDGGRREGKGREGEMCII